LEKGRYPVPLVTLQRSHLVAIGAVTLAGLLVAFRGPWSTEAAASANGITSVPAGLTTAPQVIYVDQFGRPVGVAPATQVHPLVPAVETAYRSEEHTSEL